MAHVYAIVCEDDLCNTSFTAEHQRLARMAKALAHPARVASIQLLASNTTCMSGDIAAELPLSGWQQPDGPAWYNGKKWVRAVATPGRINSG